MPREPNPINAPHMIPDLCAAVIKQACADAYSIYAADRNGVARFAESRMLGFWCDLAGWETQEVKDMLLTMRRNGPCPTSTGMAASYGC
jgi:hypothetical protein